MEEVVVKKAVKKPSKSMQQIETREAYAKLPDRANINVDPNTGIMASSGDPEKVIEICACWLTK